MSRKLDKINDDQFLELLQGRKTFRQFYLSLGFIHNIKPNVEKHIRERIAKLLPGHPWSVKKLRQSVSYTDKQLIEAVKTSFSYREVLKKLNLPVDSGTSNKSIKLSVASRGIDDSHFTGSAWNKDKITPFEQLISKEAIKIFILRERGNKCEVCEISDWQGKPIVIEMDHIDGDRTNNVRENLRLLCPNCHSQTPTFRNRNRSQKLVGPSGSAPASLS